VGFAEIERLDLRGGTGSSELTDGFSAPPRATPAEPGRELRV